jgi:hypothetical protein
MQPLSIGLSYRIVLQPHASTSQQEIEVSILNLYDLVKQAVASNHYTSERLRRLEAGSQLAADGGKSSWVREDEHHDPDLHRDTIENEDEDEDATAIRPVSRFETS